MQQLIAGFKGGTYKEKTALLLVVVDVGFHRDNIKAQLSLG